MKLLIFLLNILLSFCSGTPSVITSIGTINGMLHPFHSGVEVFSGIPFALPPIGNLRWEPPEPLTMPLNSPFNASSFGSVCPQPNPSTGLMYGNEDCLYLNIYRPAGHTGVPLPVMLWIHGGAFVSGSGDTADPSKLVSDGSVIVVTINYRLGFFGFATTFDNHLPGNYGLLDQQLAIKFTTDIISHFGGDANKITIFGQSSGGGSVMLQLLTPLNQGLLQGGISQSGSATSLKRVRMSLDVVCNNVSSCSSPFVPSKSVQTLRDASMNEIFSALDNIGNFFLFSDYAPHDGVFFPDDVRQIIASESFNCSNFIGGWNNRDGNGINYFTTSTTMSETEFVTAFELPSLSIDIEWNKLQQKVIYEHYSNKSSIGKWVDVLTDGAFMKNTLDLVKAFVNKGCPNVYSYRFSFSPQYSFFGTILPGAGHADETKFIMEMGINYTKQGTNITNRMIEYWTSFARGNLSSEWPTYNPGNKIFEINSGPRTILNVDDVYSFWEYVKMLIPTSSPTSSPTMSPTLSDAINKSPLLVLSFILMLLMINMLELLHF